MSRERREDQKERARSILARCGIPLGVDFCVLTSSTVVQLLQEATAQRYRKPRNANGSRGRYFHDMLQRRAR